MMFRILPVLFTAGLFACAVGAETVRIPADRDATLIEDDKGGHANGSGPVFHAGRTGHEKFGLRRGLVRFDVAGALPAQAVVDAVSVSLYQTSSNNTGAAEVGMHRVLEDWNEGPAASTGGGGAVAAAGDVTWLHTHHDSRRWARRGGTFEQQPSARKTVAAAGGYVWESDTGLLNDVRHWLAAPQENFGWLIMGDEQTRQSSKRFASREAPVEDRRPLLTVEYHLPGE